MERHLMPEVVIKSISNLVLSASTDKSLHYFYHLNRNRRIQNLEKVYDQRVSLTFFFSAGRQLVYTGKQNF